MTTATESRLMTTEELLAFPDDGVERELIRGELRERPMTKRNYPHSKATATIAHVLLKWLDQQPDPRGRVVGGEAGFRIRKNPDTTVGIDVAYISPQLAQATAANASIIDGPPVLAVEILSPSDKQENILEKVHDYLESGVPLVWIVEPDFRTVTVYRPDAPPALFNASQELTAEPHLPGFRTAVAALFT